MIKETAPYLMLKRARLLSDSVAWFDAFTKDEAFRERILDYIREDQLRDKGVDEDGDIIGFYSFASELISGGKKQQGDPFTLFDTGEFYESMFIRVLAKSIIIGAPGADKGEDDLFEKYGEGIIGLTEESLIKLITELRQKYIDYARRILFKGR